MSNDAGDTIKGFTLAAFAFFIWGMSAVFWKSLSHVPPFESLMHRMVWSFLFFMIIVFFTGRITELINTLKNPKKMGILIVTTIIVSVNWYIFIVAITNNRILQASLGYYINPIVNIVLGMVFLKERLQKAQTVAVLLAAAGVIYLTISQGELPLEALGLAFTFGFYALIRKVIDVSAVTGLTVETFLLFFPAVFYLIYIAKNGNGTFFNLDLKTDTLLICTALVTGLPLLLFNLGAKKLRLITIGFIQYLAPTCTFLLAVFLYKEPLPQERLIAFVFIWTALIIYSIDSYLRQRQH